MSELPPIARHDLLVPRTARYAVAGGGPHVSELVFALHGYGQLAEAFLEPFRALANERRRFVAPEGLSRFYLRGTHGEVGASWMTRESRANEITDQRLFLEAVRHEAAGAHLAARVSVLGFSQGTATACRWIARSDLEVQRLVLWGGGIPPDLDDDELAKLRKPELIVVIGTSDRYLDDELVARETKRMRESKLDPRLVRFEGGHELHGPTLAEVLA